MRSLLPALVLTVGLFAAACGGETNEAAAPTSTTATTPTAEKTQAKPATATTIAAKGGLYIGKTSQGKPMRLKIGAAGKTGKLTIEYVSSDPICGFLKISGPVRITANGTIVDPDGDVRGRFVSRRLAKGRDRGATTAEAKTAFCAVTDTVTWEARLR